MCDLTLLVLAPRSLVTRAVLVCSQPLYDRQDWYVRGIELAHFLVELLRESFGSKELGVSGLVRRINCLCPAYLRFSWAMTSQALGGLNFVPCSSL